MKLLLITTLFLSSCVDSGFESLTESNAGSITCFNGGGVMYHSKQAKNIYRSTINSWQFIDVKTGKPIEVSGDCIVER